MDVVKFMCKNAENPLPKDGLTKHKNKRTQCYEPAVVENAVVG
jgi:hypothetical protein